MASQLTFYTNEATVNLNLGAEGLQCLCKYVDHANMLKVLKTFLDGHLNTITFFDVVPDDDILGEVYRVLTPAGEMCIDMRASNNEIGASMTQTLSMYGFQPLRESSPYNLSYSKPQAIQSISININTSASNTKVNPSTGVWQVNADDLAESDLVDEEDLLNDGMVIEAPQGCGPVDTKTGKKRACKNCSCGLLQMEQEAAAEGKELDENTMDRSKSGCGNCSKGDAFRCDVCPFLGKPAFEPGQERVILSMGDDDI